MKPRVLSIILGVSDLERALVFYRDGLGLPTKGVINTTDEPGDAGKIVLFDMGSGQTLSLYRREDLARETGLPVSPSSPLEFELMYYADSADEVDQIMSQARNAGGAFTDPAHDRGGVYSGYFQDLDGHLWEVLYPLG
jgi:catechol 2,3-dioxygenase-like lactoylglutathione lyase family enzyme